MPITTQYDIGASLYALFDDASDTAVDLTEGSSLKAGVYTASDSAIATASLGAGTYTARIQVGTAAAKSAGDAVAAVVYGFVWDGANEVDALAAILTDTGTTLPASIAAIGAGVSVFSIPPVTVNSLVLITRKDTLTSNAYFIITDTKRFYSAEDNAWYNWSDVVVEDIKATVATTCARIDDDDSVNLPLLEAETPLGSNLTAGVYDLVVFASNDITQPEAGRFRVRWDGSVLYAIDSAIQVTLGTPAGASIAADIAGVDTALSPQPTALDKPAQLLRIARRFDGVIRSPDVVTIAPGETAEFGFEFKGRPRPHTAEEPTGVTETGLTAALVGVAPEWVSYSVAATDAAAVGTVDYAVCEVADKDGNVVQLVAEVRVKELHP